MFLSGLLRYVLVLSGVAALTTGPACSAPLRANLGGMHVQIPAAYVTLLELDNTVAEVKGHATAPPSNTSLPAIRSFGFHARLTDLRTIDGLDMQKAWLLRSSTDGAWISVGINAGTHFPGTGFLSRRKRLTLDSPSSEARPPRIYQYAPDLTFGLKTYIAAGTGANQRPYRQHPDAKDIFIQEDKTGEVLTYIECSNRNIRTAPCRHDFSLEPDSRAQVSIHYDRGHLPEWRNTERKVRALLLSFKQSASQPAHD